MTTPMSSDRGSLTVIVGPTGPLVGVRAVLHDWTSAGLLTDGSWVWADASASAAGKADVLLADGGFRAENLRVLIARVNPVIVRVLALQPLFEDEPDDSAVTAGAARIANLVSESAPGARVVRAHLFITRGSARRTPPVVAGWHNILLSPEDSYGPGDAAYALPVSDGPKEIGMYAAPAVAAFGGLHSGIATSPLDDVVVLPGGQVRVARTFVNRIDASAVEAQLRRQVLSMEDGLPLVDPMGRETTYVEDVRAASLAMAGNVWRRHQGLLMGPRVKQQHEKPRDIGALDALKMLFGFLVAAIKNAPMQWWRSTVSRARTTLAVGVSDFVYGGDENSAYRVVVQGVGPNGLPSDWEDTLDAIVQFEVAVGGVQGTTAQREHESLAVLWQDAVAGALTLIDGAPRHDYLPPIAVGACRGILQRGANCVPPASAAFTGFPGQLASLLPHQRIEPTDYLAVEATEASLKVLARDPEIGPLAAETLEDLQKWRVRVGQTYGFQTREVLGRHFNQRRLEIAHYVAILEAAANDSPADEQTRRVQARLARRLRWLSVGFALTLITLGVVTGLQIIGWMLGLGLLAVTVLSWFVSALVVFARGQRELFQRMNQRALAVSMTAAAQANLVQALRDARRLGDAYALSAHWMRVLGVFCAQPLGEVERSVGGVTRLHGEMPLSMGLGVAVTEDLAVMRAAQQLRGRIFRSGWASEAWQACLEAAPVQLGVDGVALLADPSALYHQRRTHEDRLLGLWVDRLEAEGLRSRAAEEKWQLTLHELRGGVGTAEVDLVTHVEFGFGPRIRRVTPGEIIADFQHPEAAVGRPDLFTPEPFSSTALVRGSHTVRENWTQSSRAGLGLVAVLVQSSEGVQATDLVGHQVTSGPVAPAVFDIEEF